MTAEWVQAGGKAGGRILFEASGDLRVLRTLERRDKGGINYEEQVAAGPGAVAVLDDGSGPVVGWIVSKRSLKAGTGGLIAPGGIMGLVQDPSGKLGTIVAYRMSPGADTEYRMLAFQSCRTGEFERAVAAIAPPAVAPGVEPS
jgi:hypothetical protein